MGKPEFKSPRLRSAPIRSRLLGKKGPTVRSSANIRVVVRVRPPNHKEQGDNSRDVVKIVDDQVLIFDPKCQSQAFFYHGVEQKGRDLLRKANKDMQFMFDRVFGFESTNCEVFENTTKGLIQSLMDGYNCSVFAYGATGAGKTHTMIGQTDNPGITYLTMAELFKAKQDLQEERKFELGISYIEVYNELVQDLLNPGAPLQLRDDGRYGVMVAGIKVHKIDNPDELFTLLAKGNGNRTQHPTDANAESSRSHAVFQVYIQMEIKATREVRAAKLSMIDLAGSERGSATGYGGARFAEGANINKSLLALGNCINSLADGQKYIPYRDSKLTRLLKDSLGGNCQTVMVANVSPSSLCYDDTYNTLKYATRAKKIKSDVKKNVVNVELHAGEYVKIVEDLKKELERVKAQLREKVTENKVDGKVALEFGKLIESRKKLLNRMYHVECSETTTVLRRQLKEDADSRLSGLLNETPEKEEAHRRLGNMVGRFHRQEDSLRAELDEITKSKIELENKTIDLVLQHPELEKKSELCEEKIGKMELQYQVNLLQKRCSILEEELRSRANLLEMSCKMLQSCYMQLRGHGFATDTLCQEYQNLVNHVQGRRNISWDSPLDSGVSSTSSGTSIDGEGDARAPRKRANDENVNGMNSTFVMEAPKPKVKVCAEELMAKVYKSPNTKPKKEGMKDRRAVAAKRPLTPVDFSAAQETTD
ncbi:kinesin-like protein KIF18A isoform X2 [Tribolium castaneum]|uniref:kinesin-like protein KIF18A isoform X2 n=1 Tax=Tribolium castaneum TaxID=7070 RepID=UPI00046BF276|nr:PREDICTED: kinesin-like protein KIF18A isoform X2 [Tribolium castaneum]|eukprot:XP_008191110.1 PREDICTED: kinesin-like protein KIF18A isoform X2 [Tribolium castaneum]